VMESAVELAIVDWIFICFSPSIDNLRVTSVESQSAADAGGSQPDRASAIDAKDDPRDESGIV